MHLCAVMGQLRSELGPRLPSPQESRLGGEVAPLAVGRPLCLLLLPPQIHGKVTEPLKVVLREGGQREPLLTLTEQDARPGQKSRLSARVVTSLRWQSHLGVGRASLTYRSLNVVFIFREKMSCGF